MNIVSSIFALLTATLTVKAYPDVVPESAELPAVSFVNIANPKGRAMDGVSQGRSSHWRVTVVANDFTGLGSIIESLEDLDNTSQHGFANIYSELVLIEPKDERALYHRAFIDLTLY